MQFGLPITLFIFGFLESTFAQNDFLSKTELAKQKEFLDLKEALKKPAKVFKLSLWDMQLTEVPTTIGKLTNIQQLRISHNQLKNLPSTFAQLTKVQRLNMEHNSFSEFPKELFALKNLERLDMHKNKLTAIPNEIAQLTQLEELDLHANQISNLPIEALAQLNKLTYLNIAENPIPKEQVIELQKRLPNTKINF